MAGRSPWSVKGVDQDAREAAKIAARRSGLTLGQWLNQTIRHAAAEHLAAAEQLAAAKRLASVRLPDTGFVRATNAPTPANTEQSTGQPEPSAAPRPAPAEDQQLTGQSAASTTPPPEPERAKRSSGSRATPSHSPTMQVLFDRIQRLSRRIEDAEKSASAAVAPLVDQVRQLSARLEEASPRDGVLFGPIERAVMRLSERIERMEEGSRPKSPNATPRGWRRFTPSR